MGNSYVGRGEIPPIQNTCVFLFMVIYYKYKLPDKQLAAEL